MVTAHCSFIARCRDASLAFRPAWAHSHADWLEWSLPPTPLHHWPSPHETLLVKVKVKSEMAGLRGILLGFDRLLLATLPTHSTTSSRQQLAADRGAAEPVD
jgi:hypothetical protein